MNEIRLTITSCDDCPNFDYIYWSFNEVCELLDREIKCSDIGSWPIPDDCPLLDKLDHES
jgi:hypothetical protein